MYIVFLSINKLIIIIALTEFSLDVHIVATNFLQRVLTCPTTQTKIWIAFTSCREANTTFAVTSTETFTTWESVGTFETKMQNTPAVNCQLSLTCLTGLTPDLTLTYHCNLNVLTCESTGAKFLTRRLIYTTRAG